MAIASETTSSPSASPWHAAAECGPRVPAFRARHFVWVVLLYVVLTCLATWPLVLHPRHTLLRGPGDNLIWAWNFSWTHQALLVEHRNPFFGELVYRPYPVSMLRHTHTFFYGMLYCLFSFLYDNPHFWANCFILGSFVLAATGTFALARRLTGHTAGALLAGAVYAYCSLRMSRVNAHLNILSSELIPWYLYFLLRAARENRARFFVAAGLCFAATTWNEYYNSLFIILFTLLFLMFTPVYRLNYGYPLRERLRAATPGLLLTLLLLLPYAWGLWRTVTTLIMLPPKGADQYYVTPLNYLLPAGEHRLLGAWLWPLYQDGLPGNSGEATVFFGYTAIFLTLYSILFTRPKSREYRYFLTCLVFFLLMSFGKTLSLRLGAFKWDLTMPYTWFLQIPFFGDFRVPARHGGMVALCAALLTAFGFRTATAAIKSPGRLGTLTAGLIALVLLENLFAPYPHSFKVNDPARVPHALVQKIRTDPVPGAVLNIPFSHEDWSALWLQTFHRKPSVTGIQARPAPWQIRYYDTLDVTGWFTPDSRFRTVGVDPLAPLAIQGSDNPAGRFAWDSRPNPWTREKVERFCYFFDLRYLLVPPHHFPTDISGRLRKELFPLEADFAEGNAWLGLLARQKPVFPIVMDAGSLADNYYFIANFAEPAGGCRWLEGTFGQVAFRLDAPRELTLRVGLGYPGHIAPGRQRLRIHVGSRLLSDLPVAPSWSEQTCTIPAGLTRPGMNYITFEPQEALSPAEAGQGLDSRKLALMFGRMTLEAAPAGGK